jgi:peptidoglycan DL-endopeptidase CwlO
MYKKILTKLQPLHLADGTGTTVSTGAKKTALILALLVIGGISSLTIPKIYADTFQDQINQLQAQNDQSQTSVDALLLDAHNYQDAVTKLQGEISVVELNISTNQDRQTSLLQAIAAKQVELDAQRKVLGDDIKAMYVNGQLSTLEMLATSKSLNDFVDSATYREAVQNKIQGTLSEIAKLQNQLQQQKVEVDVLLASQRVQQTQLDQDRDKQAELLAYNQSQQSVYNKLITDNQDKIRALQLKQAALNQQGASKVSISGSERGGDCDSGSGNGGYVLASGTQGDVCNAPKDSILDWAGVQNRECTSYAYWYFKRVEGNSDFTASGDAKYWVETSNYPVHDWPKVGAIGVKTEGDWGHVTIVQAVGPGVFKGVQVPAGQVLTSEMNSDFTGKFAYNLRGVGTLHYIYK